MSRYLQTSTANPYGHRPWATAIYTGFENYAFLKQPQNTIIREDVNMRPEIYRPPELKKPAGLGNVTVVTGSGRVVRRARRTTLGAMSPVFDSIFQRGLPPRVAPPVSQLVRAGAFTYPPPVFPGPMPVFQPICERAAPMPGCNVIAAPTAADPCGVKMTCSPPIAILPPSIVPVPPKVISSGPGGTVYALPGDATTPGSAFAPADPSQVSLPPSAVPLSTSSAAAAAETAVNSSSFSDWFNAKTLISSVPNGYLAIGGALALYMFSKKKR